ncbi:nudix hydrolase homolog 9 isoform X2 [Tasmannia lanceolata]|uniref:nudix hydrolase homolog 9 isoform X2 n=1 Tax=Tasmannia lanceolata TaxID=3420 RepID=UPI0040642A70
MDLKEKKAEEEAGANINPPPYKLLLTCPSGFSPAQIWNRRVQENPSLFNGTKFRYAGHDIGSSNQVSYVCLQLGLTDYRTFVGTNLNPLWEKFLIPSEDDSKRCQHTSSPLGNGAVVETADKKILVLERSYNVGEFPGHFVFPGGHSEPQEIGILAHQYDDSAGLKHINEKISQEMFDGIIREVVEEIGVPGPSLANPVFIGISRRELNVRPTAFFFLKCNLKSEEIQQLYSSAQDGYESTRLFTVSKGELENMSLRMPGCHQGGFALYELMIQASKDF